jgi:hypothetical protein
MHACPGSDTKPTCFNIAVAQGTLLGEAEASEGVVEVIREGG